MPITEKTLIPLGLAVAVIGGGGYWMAKTEVTVSAHASEMSQTRDGIKEIHRILTAMQKSLSQIEGELKRIQK